MKQFIFRFAIVKRTARDIVQTIRRVTVINTQKKCKFFYLIAQLAIQFHLLERLEKSLLLEYVRIFQLCYLSYCNQIQCKRVVHLTSLTLSSPTTKQSESRRNQYHGNMSTPTAFLSEKSCLIFHHLRVSYSFLQHPT